MTPMHDWRARLEALHASKRGAPRAPWADATRRAREVSTAAVLVQGAGLSLDELHDAAIDDLPAEIAEPLARVAPSFDISTIADYPPAALEGLGNAVKGALFELEVADAVLQGDLELPEGVEAIRLVEDFGTPGFDAQLLDGDGLVIDVVQLKTSQTADIIAEHLERYPAIDQVWTSHEAAADAREHGATGVVDTGISDSHLDALVHDGLVDQATTSVGEVIDEFIPQLTYAIIAAQASWQLLQGVPANEVLARAKQRAGAATAVSAIAGVAATVTGTDLVRVPVVIGVSVARAAYVELDASTHRLNLMTEVLARVRGAPSTG